MKRPKGRLATKRTASNGKSPAATAREPLQPPDSFLARVERERAESVARGLEAQLPYFMKCLRAVDRELKEARLYQKKVLDATHGVHQRLDSFANMLSGKPSGNTASNILSTATATHALVSEIKESLIRQAQDQSATENSWACFLRRLFHGRSREREAR